MRYALIAVLRAVTVVNAAIICICSGGLLAAADEPLFSGPQPGERLPAFVARGVFDEAAGKEVDFVALADQRPIVLIFVHDVNRQSVSLVRILSQYTSEKAADKVTTGVIFLHDDVTEAENTLKRIRHALAPKASVAVSLDGKEGPGSYGLNRNAMLTILVGQKGRVTANFALVQPSLQVDLPKILESIVALTGEKLPKPEDLEGMPAMTRTQASRDGKGTSDAPNMRPLLGPLIRRDASVDEVERAAAKVEEAAKKDEAVRREVGRIANTIIDAGKLTDYGTAKCQEYLQKWATEYGRPEDTTDSAGDPSQRKDPPEPPTPSEPSGAPGDDNP